MTSAELDELRDREEAKLFLRDSEDLHGDIAALLRDRAALAAVRKLVEEWSEMYDGPDAADFFEQVRPVLGIEPLHD